MTKSKANKFKSDSLRFSLGIVLCLFHAVHLQAQFKDATKLAVDTVQLKDRKHIRGIVFGATSQQEISIAVSSDWLKKFDAELFRKTVERSAQEASRARTQLLDRLKKLERPGVHPSLDFFIAKEQERLEQEIEKPNGEVPQFQVIKIKRNAVAKSNTASEANRRIAFWSWYERLADVETRQVGSLVDELKKQNVDPATQPPDLSNRFPAMEEDDDHWTARLAIVSQQFGQPFEFQGSGDTMILVGTKDRPALASLFPQMMQSQMDVLIKELTEGTSRTKSTAWLERDWVKKSIAQTIEKNGSYFRATNVRLGTESQVASVDSVFVARMSSGTWTILWKSSVEQSTNNLSTDTIKQVVEDPQVKSLRTTMELLGGSETFDKAVRMGAATMAAQKKIDEQFGVFARRYIHQFDSPPIELEPAR